MARLKEPDELITLRGVIRFARKQKLESFKYNGFEFQLSGLDPSEKRLKDLEKGVEDLRYLANQLKLKIEFGAKGK